MLVKLHGYPSLLDLCPVCWVLAVSYWWFANAEQNAILALRCFYAASSRDRPNGIFTLRRPCEPSTPGVSEPRLAISHTRALSRDPFFDIRRPHQGTSAVRVFLLPPSSFQTKLLNLVFYWCLMVLAPSLSPFWISSCFSFHFWTCALALVCCSFSIDCGTLNPQNATSYLCKTNSCLKSPFPEQNEKSIIYGSLLASFCRHVSCSSVNDFWMIFGC